MARLSPLGMVRALRSHQQATSSSTASTASKVQGSAVHMRLGSRRRAFQTVTGCEMNDAIDPGARSPPMRVFDDWRAADGWRCAGWTGRSRRATSRGSLLFAGGRGDFIEKYLEAYAHWHAARLERHRLRLARAGPLARRHPARQSSTASTRWSTISPALIADWRAAAPPGRMSRSAIRWAAICCCARWSSKAPPLDAAVLVAPMLRVNSASDAGLAGAADRRADVPGSAGATSRCGSSTRPTAGSAAARNRNLTGSRRALCRRAVLVGATSPRCNIGPPSWGWLRAAYPLGGAASRRRSSPRSTLPILLLGTERDRLVSAAAIRDASRPAAATRELEWCRRGGARDPARGRSGPARRARRGSTPSSPSIAPVSRRYDVAIVGAGIAGRQPRRGDRRRGLGADPRGGEPARLSQHRPLRRLLVGNLWRAADPAADQRLGRFLPRRRRFRRRPSSARAARSISPMPAGEAALDALAGRVRRRGVRARAARPRRLAARAPGPAAGLGRGPGRAELRRHRCRRRCTRPISSARARGRDAGHRRPAATRPSATAGAGGSRPRRARSRPISWSTPPAPGRTRSRAPPASRRSASSPIAAPWSSCASIRPRRPICRW